MSSRSREIKVNIDKTMQDKLFDDSAAALASQPKEEKREQKVEGKEARNIERKDAQQFYNIQATGGMSKTEFIQDFPEYAIALGWK